MVKNMTTKKAKKDNNNNPDIAEYLAAVDLWKDTTTRTSIASTNLQQKQIPWFPTDNLQSLLRDMATETHQDVKFFATFVERYRAAACTNGNPEDDIELTSLSPRQQEILDEMAKEKLLDELNSLYEEYTFATAKDASLTDDLRRKQKKQVSNQEQPKHSDDSLVYGEVDLEGFCNLLQSLQSASQQDQQAGTFYDLGSGSGRAVFAARFLGDFENCTGIELLPNLHQLATSVQSLYKFMYKHKLKKQTIDFHCSDFLEYDWSDGTVVYCPSLLFDDCLMERIAVQALKLQPGAFLISLKKFPNHSADSDSQGFHRSFEMVSQSVVPMSWGDASVYVYRRQ
jgi:SAM-dependent methyltransferase